MSKFLYYSIIDRHPFVVIMKQSEEGWYWWNVWDSFTSPIFNGKCRPKLDRDEHYVRTDDFDSVLPTIERNMQEWKSKVLEDHHLNYDGWNYLQNIYYRNRARLVQYFFDKDMNVITLRTIYERDKDGNDWTQMLGILSPCEKRRRFFRQSSDIPFVYRFSELKIVTQDDARARASQILDESINDYIQSIKEFCEVI